MDANGFRDELIKLISGLDTVLGVGQTGDINAPLVPGRSDIDMFVICSAVPPKEERLKMYESLKGLYDDIEPEVCRGGVWGWGDIFMVGGIDVMPMYFPVDEMRGYLEEVLAGKHLEKDGRFYPIGRLASIETLTVLYEKDRAWSDIIDRVKAHPKELFDAWYQNEISRVIDEEDLGRAELRHEVLFYHQVAEEYLDHFLQALFALNDCYFPSRKRTEKMIAAFPKKPADCYERLVSAVRLGADADTIEESVKMLRQLAAELRALTR